MVKVLLIILVLMPGMVWAQHFFQHTSSSFNTSGSATYLNHPAVNKNPYAIIFINQVYGVYNDEEVGVLYDKKSERWGIANIDGSSMPLSNVFNVFVVNKGAFSQAFHYATSNERISGKDAIIDNAFINDQPGKVILVTKHVTNNLASPVSVVYKSGKWRIRNMGSGSMVPGCAFNVLALDPGSQRMNDLLLTTFGHTSSVDNILRSITLIDNPLLNNKSTAGMLFMENVSAFDLIQSGMTRKGLIFSKSRDGSSKWAIFNHNKETMVPDLHFSIISIMTDSAGSQRVKPVLSNAEIQFYDMQNLSRAIWYEHKSDKLNFIFVNDRPEVEAICKLQNGTGSTILEGPLSAVHGFNFYQLDLTGLAPDYYILQASSPNGEIKTIRFKLNL